MVAAVPNLTRGRRRVRNLHRARLTITRQVDGTWTTVASDVPCSLRQVYREAATGDPVGASSLTRVFWRLGVDLAVELRRADQVTIALPADQGGAVVGPLIVGRVDQRSTAVERVAWLSVDETATESYLVVLERYDQRTDETLRLGPVAVQWMIDQQRPLQPGTEGGVSRWARGYLVGDAEFAPAVGDVVTGLPVAGLVVIEEVRPRVGTRLEVRIRWDEGALP